MEKLRKLFQRPMRSDQELDRSRYSLVSCGEVTPDTLQLWLGLPEEVKYDPELEKFRKLYEEIGQIEQPLIEKNGTEPNKRPSAVNSEPILDGKHRNDGNENDSSKNQSTLQNIDTDTGNGQVQPSNMLRKKSNHGKYTKMTLLLGCWVFFTVVFLTCSEKNEIIKNTAIGPGEVKNFTFDPEVSTVLVKLSGPFLSEHAEVKLNRSELELKEKMVIWLEKNISSSKDRESSRVLPIFSWTITLQDQDLDYNLGEPRSSVFRFDSSDHTLRMNTTSMQKVAMTVIFTTDPIDGSTGVVYACVLLCGLYILIIFEIINRTMAAIVVSTTSIAALALVGERPSLQELISWLDAETLLLLFSMMLLVAIMAETGIFDFLAVFTFEVTKGRLWPLIFLLCSITAILSTFLDNVTTVLLMSPVTIRLCEVMDLDPVPILMFMAIYSNIGGTATPVGDPPNVIVASNKAVVQAGINFTNFTAHMALGILLVTLQTSLQIRFMYRDTNKLRLKEPREIQDLRHQISIWRRAADSLPQLSRDVQVVRKRLERKIEKLSVQLKKMLRENSKRACPKETFRSTLSDLKDKYKIRDTALLGKATVAIVFVVTVFFLHSIPEFNRVSLSWTALLGAILLLILADRQDLEPVLHRVEWSTLLFFAALFVLMEALSKLGLILYIGGLMEQLILQVDHSARLAVALMLILWVSGMLSAFVDNIPLTTMMVRVVVAIGSNPALGLPIAPLIWALLFGACLGGNGTLIGASANVVCAGVAEQHGYRFTFMRFFRIGFPVMIGHLVTASIYLLICHCVFSWH
ncbi:P protein-like [Battus philenor]|uniref:P protein-like n=1 Tax=Battus philenor TaxID=42288 RepID=UPI0035D0DB7D